MLVNERKVRKKEREQWEDQDVAVCMALGWILERGWCEVALDKDKWRAVVSAVMKTQVP
jgi:hypothetical protein